MRRSEELLWVPSIPIGFLSDMMQASLARGIDITPILAEHGLDVAQLASTDRLVSVQHYTDILRSLMRQQRDAFVGFLSKPVPLRAFPLLCYGLVGCRTIDEVIAYTDAYYGLFSDDLHWRLGRDGDSVRIQVIVTETLDLEYRFVVHSALLMTLRLLGWLYGEDLRPLSVALPFSPRPWDTRLDYLFGCPIDHGCEEASFRISRDYDAATLSCTRDQITQMLLSTRNLFFMSRWTPPMTHRVRKLLLAHRADGWLTVEQTSRKLGMSANRLWRLLKGEGSSFIAIRDSLKREWAITLIENGDHSIEEIAEILRYGDVSAFRKAFRKWTGMQPSGFRERVIEATRLPGTPDRSTSTAQPQG